MSQEQLVQIIIDAYESRPEIKEYFEFFLNPDVEKLFEKFRKEIVKELHRTKWGLSKARVMVIKRHVKNFESMNPGPEAVMDMLFFTLNNTCIVDSFAQLTPALQNYILTLVARIKELADKYETVSQTMEQLIAMQSDTIFTRHVRNILKLGIEDSSNKV